MLTTVTPRDTSPEYMAALGERGRESRRHQLTTCEVCGATRTGYRGRYCSRGCKAVAASRRYRARKRATLSQ